MFDNCTFWRHTLAGVTIVGCTVHLDGINIYYTLDCVHYVEV